MTETLQRRIADLKPGDVVCLPTTESRCYTVLKVLGWNKGDGLSPFAPRRGTPGLYQIEIRYEDGGLALREWSDVTRIVDVIPA